MPYITAGEVNHTHSHVMAIRGERDYQFAAFEHFRDSGPHRTLTHTAKELGHSYNAVVEWSNKFFWRDRLANFLDEQRIAVYTHNEEALMKARKEMLELHAMISKRLKDVIPTLNFPKGDLAKAAKAYEAIFKIFRLLEGSSTENVAIRGNLDASQIPTDKLMAISRILSEGDNNGGIDQASNGNGDGGSSGPIVPTHPPELEDQS